MSNFGFLEKEMRELYDLTTLAEGIIYVDPASSIVKQGIVVEKIINLILLNENISVKNSMTLNEKVSILFKRNIIGVKQKENIDKIRDKRNIASHEGMGDEATAILVLIEMYTFVMWYYKEYCGLQERILSFSVPEKKTTATDEVSMLEQKFEVLLKRLEQRINGMKNANSVIQEQDKMLDDRESSYKFCGNEYTDVEDLAIAMIEEIDEALLHLQAGLLTSYFRLIDNDIAARCFLLENKKEVSIKEMYVFLLSLCPKCDKLVWRKYSWKNFNELGQSGVKAIYRKERIKIAILRELYTEGILELFCEMKGNGFPRYGMERMLYFLCDTRYVYHKGYRFKTEEKLIEYLDLIKFLSEDEYNKVMDELCEMDIFEEWLKGFNIEKRGFSVYIQGKEYSSTLPRRRLFKYMHESRSCNIKTRVVDGFSVQVMKKESFRCPIDDCIMSPEILRVKKNYNSSTCYKGVPVFLCKVCHKYYCTQKTFTEAQRERGGTI